MRKVTIATLFVSLAFSLSVCAESPKREQPKPLGKPAKTEIARNQPRDNGKPKDTVPGSELPVPTVHRGGGR